MFATKFLLAFGAVVVLAAANPGPMGGHGGPMGGPFGDLEKSLTEEQKTALKAIFTNDALTKQQIMDGVKSYFEQIGGDAATKFSSLNEKMESMKTEFISKAEEASKNFSEASKALIAQIKAIKLDMSLTPAQERTQVKALFDAAPENVKTELKSLRDQLFQGFGGHFHPTTAAPQ
uniref:SXP/RAL-2 family protein Ani s 5-like cation-binding domain-containing protein n=1 Tax=Panagrolaimus sp. PS1159 TaxID=55785 RepID=A0AC35GS03_9BILA